MKHLFSIIAVCLAVFAANAQLPQFSSTSFEDWVYTNPATELNGKNILANKIYLYKTSTGLVLTLSSPSFACFPGQVIDMNVTWITDQWQTSSFNVSKVALTATLIDQNGTPVDSVTYKPTSVSRTNYVDLSLTIPSGMNNATVRFASWKADVNSNGAVREIVMTSLIKGDLNRDGEITVADVNILVELVLGGQADESIMMSADVNGDGEITVADVNSLVNLILSIS